MIREENDCVGCPEGVPCIGSNCPMRNVPHMYCYDCAKELGLIEEEEE